MVIIVVPLILAALAAALMWCILCRSVKWSQGELFLPFLAPSAWILLAVLLDPPAKSLSNFVAENLCLTLLPVAYVFVRRFGFRGRVSARGYALIGASFLAVALLVFFLTPTLPE